MKKTLVALAMLGAFAAHAQTTESQAGAAAQAGAASQAGAVGNAIILNQNTPAEQRSTSTARVEQILSGKTVEDVRYSGGLYNSTEYSGTQTLKNVPSIAMSGPASGPCTGNSGGIGLSGPGWGVGLNGSAVMVDCRLRENSRVLGMAMQSFDGQANPQEKGEVTVMFMDSLRLLAGYNDKLMADEKITPRNRK